MRELRLGLICLRSHRQSDGWSRHHAGGVHYNPHKNIGAPNHAQGVGERGRVLGTLGVRVGVGTIPGTGVNSRGCYSGHRLAQPPCYTHHTLQVLQQGPCWQRG